MSPRPETDLAMHKNPPDIARVAFTNERIKVLHDYPIRDSLPRDIAPSGNPLIKPSSLILSSSKLLSQQVDS
jgi:hypothetical protein